MCENKVICPYKQKCSQYPSWCDTCAHNTGKRNYYKPDYQPCPTPWYPWYPYYTPTETTTGGTNDYTPPTGCIQYMTLGNRDTGTGWR